MRLYLDGTLSNNTVTFFPQSLWFAGPDCDDIFEISEDCIRLDGLSCEGWSKDGEFAFRWKGVELVCIKHDGNTTEYVETEEFTLTDFAKMIQEKKMRLVNMDVCFDENVKATVTELTITDGNDYYEFPIDRVDTVEFIV